MKLEGKIGYQAKAALLVAALIWGSSFVIMKNTVEVFPPFLLLALRFTVAFLVLGLLFFRHLKRTTWNLLWKCALIGACLFAGYAVQTLGIMETTPGKNAFLTATYCVIVPFLWWIFERRRPQTRNFAAAVLCLAGIGFISLNGALSVSRGDSLSLLSGLFFALHIVLVARFSRGQSMVLITILQFGFTALLSWSFGLSLETFPAVWEPGVVWGIAYLSVFATAIALLLQNLGQKHTHPATASILLSLESVFGVIISVLFQGDRLTFQLCVGFLLVFSSVLISELGFIFRRRREAAETPRGNAEAASRL